METAKPIPKIAELRDRVGLTQLELSQKVGVTENTIANWEKGRSGLDWIEKLIRLCRTLDCSLEDLVEYPPTAQSPDDVPSFAHLRKLYKTGKDARDSTVESNSQS